MNRLHTLYFRFLTLALTLAVTSAKAQFPDTYWSDLATIVWYSPTVDEFTLTTPQELAGLSLLVNDGEDFSGKTITLGNDINLDGHLWTPIGDFDFSPFRGSFEGNNHLIKRGIILLSSSNFEGLFGVGENASFSNVRLDSFMIGGFTDVGSLVGRLANSTVENCHATNCNIWGDGCNVGGLVGNAQYESSISGSSAEGYVYAFCQGGGLVGAIYEKASISTSFARGSVNGGTWVGGLVGISITGAEEDRINTIVDCYSRSKVTTNTIGQRGGGLLGGGDQFDIQNAYSTGLVQTDALNGSFIGNVVNGTGQNNYFDTQTSGSNEPVGFFDGPPLDLGIVGKPTAEMKTQNMVDLLNAGNPDGPWLLEPDENDGYPVLAGAPLFTFGFPMPDKKLIVFPTIFENSFRVNCHVNMERYGIYDLSGNLLASGKMSSKHEDIAPSGLKAGMYILRVHTQKGTLTTKVIKQ